MLAAVFPADANRNRTRFQQHPLRLGCDPMHKTGAASACRISREITGDHPQEAVPR
jgi:hypothetical protein